MVELLKLSSKGQVVIPKAIRNKLNLREGDRLIIFSRGNLLILRRVEGEESVLSILTQPVREKILKLGIKREDVQEAVSWTRKNR